MNTETHFTVPKRMPNCSVQSFDSPVQQIQDFARLMSTWVAEATEAASSIYSRPFRLVGVSHSFWGSFLTATFTFEEMP